MMPKLKAAALSILALSATAATAGEYMKVTTSQGVIISQLYGHSSAAPVTVQRLRDIVANGEWDADKNAFFHRSVNDFIIQGGAFGIDESGQTKKVDLNDSWTNIQNEAGDFANGVRSNIYGTMAMARFATDETPSASNQFFYNLNDNSFLNYESTSQVGFTVFGYVIQGIDNAESITDNQIKSFSEKQFAPNFADLSDRYFNNIENRNAYKKHYRDNFTRNAEEKYFETVGWYNDFPADAITRFYYGDDPMADDSFDFSSVTEPNSFFWDVEIVDLINTPLTDTPMSPTYDGDDTSLTASDFVTFSVEIYTTIDGDTDGDNDVDLQDLFNVRNNLGGHNLGDTNGDSLVNQLDLDLVLQNFGKTGPSANLVAIPEPTTLALLLTTSLALIKRNKK